MMKTMTIFPFSDKYKMLLEYKSILPYEIRVLGVFKEDEKYYEKYNSDVIKVTAKVEEIVEEADVILLLDTKKELENKKIRICAKEAQKHNKEIILTEDLMALLKLQDYPGAIKIAYPNAKHDYYKDMPLKKVSCPIVAVAGMGESSGKLDIVLQLHSYFKEKGYKSCVVSPNNLSSLFGFSLYPRQLYENLPFEEKIYCINQYVYDLAKASEPDLIILEYPGGLIPMGANYYNSFSEYALVCSNAISPDIGIFSLYFDRNYTAEKMEKLKNICKYKYNLDVDVFVLSSQRIEYDPEAKVFENQSLSSDLCQSLLDDMKDSMYSYIYDSSSMRHSFENIMNELLDNAEVL